METGREKYRGYLRDLLAERMSKNPSYSLQAFAAKAGVAKGFLSEVMSGKKNLSPQTAAKIAHRLGLPAEDADYFCLLVQMERATEPSYREKLLAQLKTKTAATEVYDLSLDTFKAISDWRYFAIIGLAAVGEFEFSVKNVADKLGMSTVEVQSAIDRLVRLELLEQREDGSFRKTKDHFLVESRFQSEAVRKFHGQVLEKLIPALETQKKGERLSRTDVLLIDPKLYPRVEAILDRAAQEIVALSCESKDNTQVSALALHLFNLIPERKNEHENANK